MKSLLVLCCVLVSTYVIFGQDADTTLPEIGKPIPDFVLHNIQYYPVKTISSKALKGKHVILDFVTMGCSSGFEALPKMDRIQRQFGPELQIFMVGRTDRPGDQQLPAVYNIFREKLQLNIPASYDASIFGKFGVQGIPHIICIDEQGIVRAITGELSAENVRAFVENGPFNVRDLSPQAQTNSTLLKDSTFVLNLKAYAQKDTCFGSSLVSWNESMSPPDATGHLDTIGRHAYYQINGLPLNMLINIAFTGQNELIPDYPADSTNLYGKMYTGPVFEMDSSKIPLGNDEGYSTGKGWYCYSLVTSPENAHPALLRRQLKNDLCSFLQLDIRKEKRMMPYWSITVDSSARQALRSRYYSKLREENFVSINYQCVAMSDIVDLLFGYNQLDHPFVDDSGIKFPIDLQMNALLTDFNDLKKQLRIHGIHVDKKLKLMDVLVVHNKTIGED